MKDIVIDTSAIGCFENPPDKEFKLFLTWIETEGAMTVSIPILMEMKCAIQSSKNSFLSTIINILLSDGRLYVKKEPEINSFDFTRSRLREFRSNKKDWVHIKLVMISGRKLCLSKDRNLRHDINLYRIHGAHAAEHPKDLAYQ